MDPDIQALKKKYRYRSLQRAIRKGYYREQKEIPLVNAKAKIGKKEKNYCQEMIKHKLTLRTAEQEF